MSGTWLSRARAREALKPADTAEGLLALAAVGEKHGEQLAKFRGRLDAHGDMLADVLGRLAALEAAKAEPEVPPKRGRG